MCRNITTLRGLEPAATDVEIEAGARQYVRKISGTRKPSQANLATYDQAVAEITAATARLVAGLSTAAPPRNREEERARECDRGQTQREQREGLLR